MKKIIEARRIRNLEYLANKLFNMSCEIRDTETESARIFMAVSWGLNRYLERVEFMDLCTRHLYMLGVDSKNMRTYQNYGYDIVLSSINKLDKKIQNMS